MRHVVILAGGVGTRLWPFSRRHSPKQFQSFLGNETLLQQTFDRAAQLVGTDNIWLITTRDHAKQAQQQLPKLRSNQIIIEPAGRNTAAAINLAATTIGRSDAEANLAIFPSDHYIGLPEEFQKVCLAALDFCQDRPSFLVTLGIQASEPNTGYGYIEIGKTLVKKGHPVSEVKLFHEKPDLKTATKFISSGRFFWNSGCFFGQAATINHLCHEYAPDVSRGVDQFVNKGSSSAYLAIPKLPFDSAVVEKAVDRAVIPANIKWSDLGSWEALYQILQESNSADNIVIGHHQGIDSNNSLIISQNKLIATVGIKDAVIIETDEAILVCRRDSVQDVKKLVEQLDELGHHKYL